MTGRHLGTLVLAFCVLAVLVISAGLEPSQLNPLVYGLTVGAYVFLVIAIRPTLRRPRIGALSERTFNGVTAAFLGTVSSIIVYNTDHERILFDQQTASILFREAVIGVLLVPTIWIVLYLSGRLGQDQ